MKHQIQDNNKAMLIGLVKWFDPNKGFGVIGTPNGKEYFIHINSFLRKPDITITKGAAIIFFNKIDERKNRNIATESRFVGELEDWELIFSFLGKQDTVSIEVEVNVQGVRGNYFKRKEIHLTSIISRSLKQFFIGKSKSEIINTTTNYFDNELDDEHFISYCTYIDFWIRKRYSEEVSIDLLHEIFSHFKENLNEQILFDVWKENKLNFIGYRDEDNYEIPISILLSNISKIDIPELRRILCYTYGYEFYSKYVDEKFRNINNKRLSEIKELYDILEFENENKRVERKLFIDKVYVDRVEYEIVEKANSFGVIKNNDDFNNYNKLILQIPNDIDEGRKTEIRNILNKTLISNCNEEFKPELWIRGIIEELPYDKVLNFFLSKETTNSSRVSALSKLEIDTQFELLKNFSKKYGFEHAFDLIEGLLIKDNSFNHFFELSDVLFDINFWKNTKHKDLVVLYTNYVNNESNDNEKYELFFKGYVKDVPLHLIFQNVNNLGKNECMHIFKSIPENKNIIKSILDEKIATKNISDFDWLYDLANDFLDIDGFNEFDQNVFITIKQAEYFTLWETGKAKIFPCNQIGEMLNDRFENYLQINKWIASKLTNDKQITDFLLSYLCEQVRVTDRIIFYKQLNIIKYLLSLNDSYLEKIKQLENEFYNVILWYLDKENGVNFDLLKKKFIYFAPEEQVRIIRKLFYLKATGIFDLTVEKLDELTRFDLDLYRTSLNFNPDIPIDISTDVVIKALLSFKQNKRFIIENELLEVVLNNLKLDETRSFKLSDYFEDCLGRLTADFNWNTNGKISKHTEQDPNGAGITYFAIEFEYNHGLVEEVKRIPGRRWSPNENHWTVPLRYEKDVMSFAKGQRFFLDFEGSNYTNNIHLVHFKRKDIPNGILFCEGRLANRSDNLFNKEFWWCVGQKCFGKCETIHSSEEWEKYTLLDFCEIMNLNTDEINKMGDRVNKGKYYQFISLINRFNRLLEKMYCEDCSHILYPSDFGTSHFASYTVVRFQCRNENCSNNDVIYLNHCLNGQCNNIVDSRVSKRCENGLLICNNCGSCCSHKQFETRLNNLINNDKTDTPKKQWIVTDLTEKIKNKKGHLDKAEYFCYKCGITMKENPVDVFTCHGCSVEYDTTPYRFNRIHLHLKQAKAFSQNYRSRENDSESISL